MPDATAVAAGPGVEQGLDSRTKIVLVIVCSVAVMSPGGLQFVPAALVLAIGLAVWEGARRRALGMLLAAVGMWMLGWVLPAWWQHPVSAVVSIACVYAIRFVAVMGVGAYVVATTSPTQLAAGLRSWHVPRPISVTLSVMLRFFPVVAAEVAAVLDAMRLRGLLGAHGMLRHPVLSIERFTVPVIAASLRASEDLSASAILRGLGSRRTPTAMHPPRLGLPDLLLGIAVAGLAIASLLLPEVLA